MDSKKNILLVFLVTVVLLFAFEKISIECYIFTDYIRPLVVSLLASFIYAFLQKKNMRKGMTMLIDDLTNAVAEQRGKMDGKTKASATELKREYRFLSDTFEKLKQIQKDLKND